MRSAKVDISHLRLKSYVIEENLMDPAFHHGPLRTPFTSDTYEEPLTAPSSALSEPESVYMMTPDCVALERLFIL